MYPGAGPPSGRLFPIGRAYLRAGDHSAAGQAQTMPYDPPGVQPPPCVAVDSRGLRRQAKRIVSRRQLKAGMPRIVRVSSSTRKEHPKILTGKSPPSSAIVASCLPLGKLRQIAPGCQRRR